jgi:HEAT repeat protein
MSRLSFAGLVLSCAPVCALALAPRATAHAFVEPGAGGDKDTAELDAAAKKLKDSDDRARREAVQELAKIATPQAWALVVDALRDPSARVADEAQVALGTVSDAKVIEDLLGGKALGGGEAYTRLRTAEALGRITAEVDALKIVQHLDEKDDEVRRTIVWTLERRARANRVSGQAQPKVVAALEKLATKDRAESVRAAAIVALNVVDKTRGRELVEAAIADKSATVRAGALHAARDLDNVHKLGLANRLADDADPAVRAEAIDLFESVGSKSGVQKLVARLEKEPSLRLRWRIVGALQRLSGSDLELNVPYWKKWADGLTDTFAPATAGPKKAPPKLAEGTTVFMGLPVLTERVAILVDFSGSLWEKKSDGKTRKEVVDVELEKTLAKFTPQTKFNVIPYTKDPLPWEKALVPASKENVARALDFFKKCTASGKGNVWDAIELALKDPEVDTLLILTDGAPTGGRRWNLELMRSLFAEKNRFRHVALDAVLVDAGKFLQGQWTEMCEQNNGHMESVDLE